MDPELMCAASCLLNRHVNSQRFRAHFGVPYCITNILWLTLAVAGEQFGLAFLPQHVLWALHFLKIYPLQDEGAVFCDCDHKTRNKWIWLVLLTFYSILDMVCGLTAVGQLLLCQNCCFVFFCCLVT